MNFSVHMDEKTLSELTQTAKIQGMSRSALLTEAFRQYVKQQQLNEQNNGWPKELIDHLKKTRPIKCPDFDDTSDLLQLKEFEF
jgi:metal-responsive CopG/Arc/MetJ family transcriptional regulator